jgi:hypothetical protein
MLEKAPCGRLNRTRRDEATADQMSKLQSKASRLAW